jgi:predicted nucleotidyltransferase
MNDRRKLKLPEGVTAEQIVAICAKHGAHNVRVFGSFARGEAKRGSDLDLLVDLESGRGVFGLIELQDDLRGSLPCNVEVLTEGFLSPYFRETVLREAVRL